MKLVKLAARSLAFIQMKTKKIVDSSPEEKENISNSIRL